MNNSIICCTCGTWYERNNYPELCKICDDERQYVPGNGQQWVFPETLLQKHSIKVNRIRNKLHEFEVNPVFAIGQRALLLCSAGGNVLWDCIPLIDEPAIEFIKSKGGLRAIALSHPHFYSSMNEWAAVFDCPVYIHENDAAHIMLKGPHIQLWKGDELELWDNIRIMLIGGHFAGSSILHVPFLSEQGTIICGDTLFLSPSKKHFSLHWSSPNRMPLPISELKRIKSRLDSISFDAFYGYIKTQNLSENVKKVLEESMNRYFV